MTLLAQVKAIFFLYSELVIFRITVHKKNRKYGKDKNDRKVSSLAL